MCFCQAEPETDEVFAQLALLPELEDVLICSINLKIFKLS
jgi:hypothetical protein